MDNTIAMTPMPRYVSHKKVWALKIKTALDGAEGVSIEFEDACFAPRLFTYRELDGKPKPKTGWYMIQYDDGYLSFSPAQAFESGYTRL